MELCVLLELVLILLVIGMIADAIKSHDVILNKVNLIRGEIMYLNTTASLRQIILSMRINDCSMQELEQEELAVREQETETTETA